MADIKRRTFRLMCTPEPFLVATWKNNQRIRDLERRLPSCSSGEAVAVAVTVRRRSEYAGTSGFSRVNTGNEAMTVVMQTQPKHARSYRRPPQPALAEKARKVVEDAERWRNRGKEPMT